MTGADAFRARGYELIESQLPDSRLLEKKIIYSRRVSIVGEIETYHANGVTESGYSVFSSNYNLTDCLDNLLYWFDRAEEHALLEKRLNDYFGDTWKPIKENPK